MNRRDDTEVGPAGKATAGSAGRNVIAVIGIDRYDHWPPLSNAVRDATGAAALFGRLGFEEITAPLLGDRATGMAIQSLVTDDLMTLGPDDSLVLFYAGHGGTRGHRLGDEVIKAGYLIPVDASVSPDRVSTWVDLEGWLRAVSLLPAKHILVVLDACHSGIALDPIIKWRDIGSWQDTPLATLQARRSRRIITSALDDQVALDGGPVHGHSLFTGCLIEGLTGGIRGDRGAATTGSELGLYVQRRVQTYPNSRQTPDFGTFAFDDRGEMVIPLVIERVVERQEEAATTVGLQAWIDLIDLGDEPELASEVESRPDDAPSATDVEAHRTPGLLAVPVSTPPDGAADELELSSEATVRPDDGVSGVEAHEAGADRRAPASAGPAPAPTRPSLPTASPAPSSPPQTPVLPPDNVATIARAPEPALASVAPVSTPSPARSPTDTATPSPPSWPTETAGPTAPTSVSILPAGLTALTSVAISPAGLTPSLPPPTLLPRSENVATSAWAPEPAQLVAAEPVPATAPRPPRSKRSTPILPPLPPPLPPPETAAPAVPKPDARRRILLGGMAAAALAFALIGYLVFGHESPPVDPPTRIAASSPPDAPRVDAAAGVAADGSPEAQPRPAERADADLLAAKLRSHGCPPGMVRVPAGTFRMGSPAGIGDADEHPQHEVTLSAYCIDRTEVTVKAYAACVAAKGCSAAPPHGELERVLRG